MMVLILSEIFGDKRAAEKSLRRIMWLMTKVKP